MKSPLCVDLFCGCFGWSAGWLEMGGRVVGFDIEHLPHHGPIPKGADLIIQDVMTLHGRQFKDASLILCSPPCTEYSWMAMPWSRGKQVQAALLGKAEFPEGYKGSRTIAELTALFDACFRIQREACAAAGRHIPMVIENVRGAQKWVGKAAWNFGSFYLWGDVPALMPMTARARKSLPDSCKRLPGAQGGKLSGWPHPADGQKVPNFRFDGSGRSFQTAAVEVTGVKNSRNWWSDGKGNLSASTSSKSNARKAASAQIAKIPLVLSSWIARCWKPIVEGRQ